MIARRLSGWTLALRGDGFEDVRARGERGRVHQAQGSPVELARELGSGALAAARVGQHHEVEEGGRELGVARRQALRHRMSGEMCD